VLAHHYATALELDLAADETEQAAALEAPAIRFLTLAGQRALGLDSSAAVTSFERALALTPPGHPARPEVLAGLGEAALEADRLTEAVAALQEAIDAYRTAGDPRSAARVAVVLSEVYVLQRNRERLEMLTETLALLQPVPPGHEHVAVLTEISGEHDQHGQPEMGLEFADRALALAAELGLGRPARTLGYRATNRSRLEDPGATDDFREALEVALAAGQVRHASTVYNNWAAHRGRFEGPAEALETLDEGIALCRARGLTARVNFMTPGTFRYLFAAGELDRALAVAQGQAERARLEGDASLLATAQGWESAVLLVRARSSRLAAVGDKRESRSPEYDCEITQPMSIEAVTQAQMVLVNESDVTIDIYWLNYQGGRVRYQTLAPGQNGLQHTYLTHPWLAVDRDGVCHGYTIADAASTLFVIP
jgi:tetratricopeptide (TPR) repeat protein